MNDEQNWLSAKILSIDDELLIVKVAAKYLKNVGFTNVEWNVGSKDALAKIEEFQPDLILLDINMPEINGIELLKQLKADARFTKIIVIMLSAAGDDARREAFELGAFDFITKPIVPTNLVLRVTDALRDFKK